MSWRAVLLHDPLEKVQRDKAAALRRDHRLQDLAFMVDGAPEIAELAIDLCQEPSWLENMELCGKEAT
jgi:hypothetical protein